MLVHAVCLCLSVWLPLSGFVSGSFLYGPRIHSCEFHIPQHPPVQISLMRPLVPGLLLYSVLQQPTTTTPQDVMATDRPAKTRAQPATERLYIGKRKSDQNLSLTLHSSVIRSTVEEE